ncbi:hypothetical protein AZH53_08395 [Methanomicrobiaceae archaeon CYW5]|uniref:hypothetical protein n=1 Tax=Methanovulcanius yangii TaxID=1789227 RepID=UPI0029CA19E4|nr:hypothetical protein [Methanovulcanius yangii]MBT8508422.1 hypothetical protein [Methanovulcanius yangii]
MKRSSYATIAAALLLILVLFPATVTAIDGLEENRSVAIEGAESLGALLVRDDGGVVAGGADAVGPALWFIGADGEMSGNGTVGAGNATTISYLAEARDGNLLLFTDASDLLRVDETGTIMWTWHLPFGEAAGLDSDGESTYIASNYIHAMLYKVGPGGTEQWNRSFADTSGVGYARLTTVRMLADGGFAAAGYVQPLADETDPTGFLLLGDGEGVTTAEVRYGHEGIGYITSLRLRPDGGFLATAIATDGVTPLLLRLSPGGTLEESIEFGKRLEMAYWAAEAPTGGAYVLGYDADVVTGEPQYLLLGLDEAGSQAWMLWFGDDRVTAIAKTGDGGIAVGTGTGTITVYLPETAEGGHVVTDWWLILFGILAGGIAFLLIKRQM